MERVDIFRQCVISLPGSVGHGILDEGTFLKSVAGVVSQSFKHRNLNLLSTRNDRIQKQKPRHQEARDRELLRQDISPLVHWPGRMSCRRAARKLGKPCRAIDRKDCSRQRHHVCVGDNAVLTMPAQTEYEREGCQTLALARSRSKQELSLPPDCRWVDQPIARAPAQPAAARGARRRPGRILHGVMSKYRTADACQIIAWSEWVVMKMSFHAVIAE